MGPSTSRLVPPHCVGRSGGDVNFATSAIVLAMEVEWDGHCFGCGPLNGDGLRLKFEPGPDGSVAEYTVEPKFQSWTGMAHGGMVALMLDEAVGWAAWHAGHPGVTGGFRFRSGAR